MGPALTGTCIEHVLPAILATHEVWDTCDAPGEVNRWFEKALERAPLRLVECRRLKLRYMTQAKARAPIFLVLGIRAE